MLSLQMLAISKFNLATTLFETLRVHSRTLEKKTFVIPCAMHLAVIFKIFCDKPPVPMKLFIKSFIPA